MRTGDVLDVAGFIGSFAEDGVFNNVVGQESYRGEHLGDLVLRTAMLIPDVHRELHRVTVLGDAVAVELAAHRPRAPQAIPSASRVRVSVQRT